MSPIKHSMHTNNSITALNNTNQRKQRVLHRTAPRDNNSPVSKTMTRPNTRKFKWSNIGPEKEVLQEHTSSKRSFIESMYYTGYKYWFVVKV
jgi:hypothetical protein